MDGPNREIVFHVRVVRDVRAKLCANYPGDPGSAQLTCPTPAPVAAAPAAAAPLAKSVPA